MGKVGVTCRRTPETKPGRATALILKAEGGNKSCYIQSHVQSEGARPPPSHKPLTRQQSLARKKMGVTAQQPQGFAKKLTMKGHGANRSTALTVPKWEHFASSADSASGPDSHLPSCSCATPARSLLQFLVGLTLEGHRLHQLVKVVEEERQSSCE